MYTQPSLTAFYVDGLSQGMTSWPLHLRVSDIRNALIHYHSTYAVRGEH